MLKRKLSPVIYKKSKNFKKFLEKSKQKLLRSNDNHTNNKTSLTTPVTNDDFSISEKLQIYDNGCDYFKVMNTKEATMSTTCDDNNDDVDDEKVDGNDDAVDVFDDDNDNKQSVASSCYASILTDNGSDNIETAAAADDDDASDCCDDTNNHSNNNGNNKSNSSNRNRVINDISTSVASNLNKQSNKQIHLNKPTTLIRGTNKNHHKVSNKTNDTDDEHVVGSKDDDYNEVVDNINSNVDNVKYNKHHKTCANQQQQQDTDTYVESTIIPSYMPVKIKQEHLDSLPLLASSSYTFPNSTTSSSSLSSSTVSSLLSFENCEHHKIKNCEIHQQPQQSSVVSASHGHIQNSIVQQLGTFVSNYRVRVNYGQNSTGCRRDSTTSLSKW
ncbi:probable cyclin-dependent serine/threonine-protein kinase DDB_G0292550 [Lucilia cuprina]|uniref:probable cyclin-dependent serine/threonine-protein kinase DDB_G0292550 n=1 Tax=Lucilia cuprina TaxID=7375 RepID=UPI001F063F99|nr:probable cyclin-dependent serine/threonine-protein kinase DDB_G0292550 [Lucilia cuprina]